MPHVLLLRAPSPGSESVSSKDDGDDPYEAALRPFKSTSIPVYETLQTLEELEDIISMGATARKWAGVVATSKRAVDAWANAAANARVPTDERGEFCNKLQCQLSSFLLESWSHVPCYVVGEATGRAVREMKMKLEVSGRSHVAPGEILGAQEAGTGEQLAHFIITRLDSKNEVNAAEEKTKLLFLVGDKTKDSLPTILGADRRVDLVSVPVYATRPSPHLAEALALAIEKDGKGEFSLYTFLKYDARSNNCLRTGLVDSGFRSIWH